MNEVPEYFLNFPQLNEDLQKHFMSHMLLNLKSLDKNNCALVSKNFNTFFGSKLLTMIIAKLDYIQTGWFGLPNSILLIKFKNPDPSMHKNFQSFYKQLEFKFKTKKYLSETPLYVDGRRSWLALKVAGESPYAEIVFSMDIDKIEPAVNYLETLLGNLLFVKAKGNFLAQVGYVGDQLEDAVKKLKAIW